MGEVKTIMHDEKKDFDKAHEAVEESLEETADKIAEDVASISEEVETVEVKVAPARKAHTVFTSVSESVEVKVAPARKAHTVFPNLR